MGFVLRATIIACVTLFLCLLTLVAVEDWQAAVAAVNYPEWQIRGNLYSPHGMSCAQMLQVLSSLADPENYDSVAYNNLQATIRVDLDTLAEHGYNLIRIYFHPKVDTESCILRMPDDSIFCAMDTLLAMLDEQDLKLYVSLTGNEEWAWEIITETTQECPDPPCTLISCKREAVSDSDQFKAWLDSLLIDSDSSLTNDKGYGNHPTITYWDLRTEGPHDDSVFNDWARAVLPHLQSIDTTTQVTRGLGSGGASRTDTVRGLGDFDIYSWHSYMKRADTTWNGDTIVDIDDKRYWTEFPDSLAKAREGSREHTIIFGEFGCPVDTFTMYSEMEQRQFLRDLFYKMMEQGCGHGNIFKMYDIPGKHYFGVYREDRRFKPSGELIEQIFNGDNWEDIPTIGNWHAELDDRLNWQNLWKPDPNCDPDTCDTCGSIQPSCWRNKIWGDESDTNYITFEWDTAGGDTSNHTDPEIFTLFTPRASLKIIMDPPEDDTLEASWYFRCCGPGLKERTAVAPGVSYTCSAYVWIQGNPDSVGLGIRWYNKSGAFLSDSNAYTWGGSFNASQWNALSYTCTSLTTAYSGIVSCNVYSTEACTVRFDDVQLYEGLRWKTYYPDTVVITYGDTTTEDKSKLAGDDGDRFSFGSQRVLEGQNNVQKIDWYSEVEIYEDPDDVTGLTVAYDGHYDLEDTVKQFICLYNFDDFEYDTLCATDALASCKNLIRQADITHGWSTDVDSIAQRYIDPDYRTIRMRVVIEPESSVDSCRCWADYMKYSVRYKTE